MNLILFVFLDVCLLCLFSKSSRQKTSFQPKQNRFRGEYETSSDFYEKVVQLNKSLPENKQVIVTGNVTTASLQMFLHNLVRQENELPTGNDKGTTDKNKFVQHLHKCKMIYERLDNLAKDEMKRLDENKDNTLSTKEVSKAFKLLKKDVVEDYTKTIDIDKDKSLNRMELMFEQFRNMDDFLDDFEEPEFVTITEPV
jgi:hypothetical protein